MVSLSMAGGRYRDGGYGGGYYSVCFREEFVTCVGALAGGMFKTSIVFTKKVIEKGCEVRHCMLHG